MKHRPLAKQKGQRPSKKHKDESEFSFAQPKPKKQARGATAYCPGCDGRVSFTKRPKPNAIVRCPECSTDLEVISLAPLMLDYPSIEGEDGGWEWD